MARVLLTGASGFVGREAALHLLAHGHEVHALGRHPPEADGVTFHRADLLSEVPDLAGLGATHLLHCAWYAEPGKFWNAAENLDWVAASLRLVREFAAAGGTRVTIAGTCAEYAWDRPLLHEDRLGPPPETLYGQAKRSLFEVLRAAAPVLGISLGWGRIFTPFGAREYPSKLLGTLIAARREGREVEISSGEQIRDFLHVADVAGALVAIMESDVQGAVNVGSGEAMSVRHFIELAARLADYSDKLRIGSRQRAQTDPHEVVADTTRLRQEVGFAPRLSLEAGLALSLGLAPEGAATIEFQGKDCR